MPATESISVQSIQEKTEIVKRKFLILAKQFEEETGTQLSIAVERGPDRELTTFCTVKIINTDIQIQMRTES